MNDDHINLFIEIIKESKYKLQNKFPGIDFHVIFGFLTKNNRSYLRRLKSDNIKYHKITNVLTDKKIVLINIV